MREIKTAYRMSFRRSQFADSYNYVLPRASSGSYTVFYISNYIILSDFEVAPGNEDFYTTTLPHILSFLPKDTRSINVALHVLFQVRAVPYHHELSERVSSATV